MATIDNSREILQLALDIFVPYLVELNQTEKRIKAMKKKRLELIRANRSLVKKISEYKS